MNAINDFLEILKSKDLEKFKTLIQLRSIVLEIYPNVLETFKYGGIMFSLEGDFGGLFVSKKHVSFEFTHGYQLSSTLKLEGSGKFRRHLKITELNKEFEQELKLLLKQVETIDRD